jgi:hypothetical protein
MKPIHDRIIEGDGTSTNPFVIHTSNHMLSAQIQNEILDRVLGAGAWGQQERRYYPSQRGQPGNEDLCEHLVTVGGQPRSIWFDLYLVTRLVNDPGLKEAKRKLMESPGGQQATAAIRQALFQSPQTRAASSSTPAAKSEDPEIVGLVAFIIGIAVGGALESFWAGFIACLAAYLGGAVITAAVKGIRRLFQPKPIQPAIPVTQNPARRKPDDAPLSLMFRGNDIFLNEAMTDRQIVIVGRSSNLSMSGARFLAALVYAKMNGWEGGHEWFFTTQSGLTAIDLRSNMAMSDDDAASFTAILRRNIDWSAARDRALDDLRPLRDLTEHGGFSILLPVATYQTA